MTIPTQPPQHQPLLPLCQMLGTFFRQQLLLLDAFMGRLGESGIVHFTDLTRIPPRLVVWMILWILGMSIMKLLTWWKPINSSLPLHPILHLPPLLHQLAAIQVLLTIPVEPTNQPSHHMQGTEEHHTGHHCKIVGVKLLSITQRRTIPSTTNLKTEHHGIEFKN